MCSASGDGGDLSEQIVGVQTVMVPTVGENLYECGSIFLQNVRSKFKRKIFSKQLYFFDSRPSIDEVSKYSSSKLCY